MILDTPFAFVITTLLDTPYYNLFYHLLKLLQCFALNFISLESTIALP